MKVFFNAEFLKNKPLDRNVRRKELMKKIRDEYGFSFDICKQLVNAFDIESNGFRNPLKVEIDFDNIDISEEIKNYLKTYHTFTVFNLMSKNMQALYISWKKLQNMKIQKIFFM